MNLFNENIKFMHFRQFNKDGSVNARGGFTVAYYEEGGMFTFAFSKCSKSDNYNKFTGRAVAVARLRDQYSQFVTDDVQEFRSLVESNVATQFGFQRSFGKKRKTKLAVAA